LLAELQALRPKASVVCFWGRTLVKYFFIFHFVFSSLLSAKLQSAGPASSELTLLAAVSQ
jgi:hypothetical protein